MNMKFISKIDPRLAIALVLALAFVGTIGTATYGFMLSNRVGRILTQVDKTLAEVTSGTTTRVADKATTATKTRDTAAGAAARSVAATSGTRGAAGMTTASRAAMRNASLTSGARTAMREGRTTSGSRAALNMQTSGSRVARNAMTSGSRTAMETSGSRVARNAMTSGSRTAMQTSGSRMAGMPGQPGAEAVMRGRGSRGGGPGMPGTPGMQIASAALPTTVTQLIETKGLFGRKPQPQEQCSLQGILGQSALINGQWIKIGESQGSVKLLELTPFKAVVEFKGARRELTMWSDLPQG